MKVADFIRTHNACPDGARWALSVSSDMSAVWDTMIEQGKHDWFIWTATRPGVFSESILRKLACRFVRETPLSDGRMVWDLLTDDRSKKAVEVSERYADGKATKVELADARSAARAAAYAAWAAIAAARAAAYAADAAYYAAARSSAYATYAAGCAADAAARAALAARTADAAAAAAWAVDAAYDAQVQMIAALGNPFKER
jgi:hypothetical protein